MNIEESQPKWIQQAIKYVNVEENPKGSNWGGDVERWIKAQGFSKPVYWCAIFVSQMFREVEIYDKRLYSAKAYDFSKNSEAYRIADLIYGRYKAKSGDILVRKNHVNFVAEWQDKSGFTIGGNESDGVRLRKTNIKKMIDRKVKYIVNTDKLLED